MAGKQKRKGSLVVVIAGMVLETFPKVVSSSDVQGTPILRKEIDIVRCHHGYHQHNQGDQTGKVAQ